MFSVDARVDGEMLRQKYRNGWTAQEQKCIKYIVQKEKKQE